MAILEPDIAARGHAANHMRTGVWIKHIVLLEIADDGGIIVSRIGEAGQRCAGTNHGACEQFAALHPHYRGSAGWHLSL